MVSTLRHTEPRHPRFGLRLRRKAFSCRLWDAIQAAFASEDRRSGVWMPKGPRGLPGDTGQSVLKAMHPNVGKRSPQMPDRRNEMRKQRPSAPLVHSLGWFQNHSGNLIGTDDSLQLPRSPVRSGRISTLRRTNSREYPSFDPMTSTLSDTCRRP